MTAAWLVGALILVIVLGTYVLQAILIAVRLVVGLVAYVAFPLLVLLIWLVILPVRPRAAIAWMRGALNAARRPSG